MTVDDGSLQAAKRDADEEVLVLSKVVKKIEDIISSKAMKNQKENVPYAWISTQMLHGKRGLQYFRQQKEILEDLHIKMLSALSTRTQI